MARIASNSIWITSRFAIDMEKGYATHGFPACYDENSRILILGSFPSIKSREMGFFYGHPQNRFWKILERVFQEEVPASVEGRRQYALSHHLALYDSLESCLIKGSEDASIEEEVPADLSPILKGSKIKRILLNGKKAQEAFYAHQKVKENIEVIDLPSTSSANASWRLERLIEVWGKALL